MALNVTKLLSVGRKVVRLARQVQRQSSARDGGPISRGGDRGGDRDGIGGVTDYPGDFHGQARVTYSPIPGPEAGPGEVVWTWVPFEELDGRGKDRPVLVVGRNGGHLLAAQLTSRDRNNAVDRDADYIDIGAGPWDPQGRHSEVKLDRIVQVDPRDVRREGGVVNERMFETVSRGLRDRNGWS